MLKSMQRRPGLDADERLLAITTLTFDIAVLEIFLPLVSGARVVIAPSETGVTAGRWLNSSRSAGPRFCKPRPVLCECCRRRLARQSMFKDPLRRRSLDGGTRKGT